MKSAITLAFLLLMGSIVSMAAELPDLNAPVEIPDSLIMDPSPGLIHENNLESPCSSCHNQINRDIEYKLPNHFVTNMDCGSCHYTQRWIPLRIYSHINARYRRPGNFDPQDCTVCHVTNSQFMSK